jgi:putative colanic acid biosynthesis acetyltransferase WcaF
MADKQGVPDTRIFQTLDRTARAPYTRGEYLRRYAWLLTQATLFRIPLPGLNHLRRALLRAFGARIGHASYIHHRCHIMHPWLLELGDWSCLSERCTVYNLGPVKIGDHTVLSQDVYVCAGSHDHTRPDLPLLRPTIVIGSGVWIAAGAFIGPGVTVGDNSVIGARAMVAGDIPPAVVAAGNPCRIIKDRDMKHPA